MGEFADRIQRSELPSAFQNPYMVTMQVRHLRKLLLRYAAFPSRLPKSFSEDTAGVWVPHAENDSSLTSARLHTVVCNAIKCIMLIPSMEGGL